MSDPVGGRVFWPDSPGYDGPIEVGMRFLWEPFKPWATKHVKVVRVDVDGRVWLRGWVATSRVSGQYSGGLAVTDESRLREAAMAVGS